jgi:two-component system, NtrC family, sensor histidine kinase HydH
MLPSFAPRLWKAFVSEPAQKIDAEIWRRGARERAFARLVRARVYLAPLMAIAALSFAILDDATWRRVVLGFVCCMLLVVSYGEWVRYRTQGLSALMVPFNVVAMGFAQMSIVMTTGGLFSFLIPAVAIFAVLVSTLTTRPTVMVMLGMQVPIVWMLAFVHATGWPVPTLIPNVLGDANGLEHGIAPWVLAVFDTAFLIAGTRIGGALGALFEDLMNEALAERDRSLAMHIEQNRALTTLSGEIAHELKNPLASVKGLSSLVAKDVEGKTAERLAVLRREVDRMQSILEEFLNFSRPLVPLSLSEVELGQLARDIVRLHEGSASERNVAISIAHEAPVWLTCDPRKIKQVLINLVQNALDASPASSELEIEVQRTSDGGVIRVLDRGTGIDPDVEDRIFDAGVTTKDHGSGLGLALARSLARQHGGELTLENREGGGCAAVLTLLREPKSEGAP